MNVRAAPMTRRAELLALAADLFAERGFANVTVDDLGDAAGVSGPALYHHFAGKEALLGEMLVGISERLLEGCAQIAAAGGGELLTRLVRFHCEFAVDDRSLITVHMRDLVHTADADCRRIRRLQARYTDVWVDAIVAEHPAIDPRRARAAAHAAFGLINSTPFSASQPLPRAQMVDLLASMAAGALASLHPAPR